MPGRKPQGRVFSRRNSFIYVERCDLKNHSNRFFYRKMEFKPAWKLVSFGFVAYTRDSNMNFKKINFI